MFSNIRRLITNTYQYTRYISVENSSLKTTTELMERLKIIIPILNKMDKYNKSSVRNMEKYHLNKNTVKSTVLDKQYESLLAEKDNIFKELKSLGKLEAYMYATKDYTKYVYL